MTHGDRVARPPWSIFVLVLVFVLERVAIEYEDEEVCKSRSSERYKSGDEAQWAIRESIDTVRADVLEVLQALD